MHRLRTLSTKTLGVLFGLVLLFGVAACGDDDDTPIDTGQTTDDSTSDDDMSDDMDDDSMDDDSMDDDSMDDDMMDEG